MFRKSIASVLAICALFWLFKATSFFSYAGTLWGQVARETKKQVPTKFEIERAKHEIAALDQDISNMLRPIAEYMAVISRLKKDIQASRASLADHKISILTMAKDLEGNPTILNYGGEEYSADRVRQKLQRDFDSYKRNEAHLKSQEKLLEAKERSLTATREQLSKLVAKKKEYEVRVAQLEADEETLQIARIGSKVHIDDNRASEIEAALADIEHRHEVQRAEVELLGGPFANDFIPVQQRTRKAGDLKLEDIHHYFGKGGVTSKTAVSRN